MLLGPRRFKGAEPRSRGWPGVPEASRPRPASLPRLRCEAGEAQRLASRSRSEPTAPTAAEVRLPHDPARPLRRARPAAHQAPGSRERSRGQKRLRPLPLTASGRTDSGLRWPLESWSEFRAASRDGVSVTHAYLTRSPLVGYYATS